MAVEVHKAMTVHKSEILGLIVGRTAGAERSCDKTVDLLSALAIQVKKDLDGFRRIANGFGSEFAELRMGREHDCDRFADDDHRRVIAGHLWVLGIAKRLEKGLRLRQVNGNVEANLLDHGTRSFDYYFDE